NLLECAGRFWLSSALEPFGKTIGALPLRWTEIMIVNFQRLHLAGRKAIARIGPTFLLQEDFEIPIRREHFSPAAKFGGALGYGRGAIERNRRTRKKRALRPEVHGAQPRPFTFGRHMAEVHVACDVV